MTTAWAAGYHMREAKRARQQLEYHEQMAQVCKDKGRNPAGPAPAETEDV